jgi:hypothetical protein
MMMNTDKPPYGSLALLPVIPALFALGLWLLGVPLDWSTWKTYAGLAVLALVIGLA